MNNKILLIDDEISVLELLSMRLKEAGYDVYTESSAKTGLQLFKECGPFLLLTDLNLLGVDGATLAGQIHVIDPMCICIAITGFLDSFSLGYLLGSVFTDVLIKPVSDELLLSVVAYAQDKYQRWQSY